MPMRLGGFVAVLVAVAAGCAVAASASGCVPACFIHPSSCQQRSSPKSAEKTFEVECTDEAPTGTNISRSRCYRRGQAEERRQNDRAATEKLQTNTPRPSTPSPGSRPFVVPAGNSQPTATTPAAAGFMR